MDVETVTKRLQTVGLDITVDQVMKITDGDKIRQFYTVTCESLIDMLCDFHPNLNNVAALNDMSDAAVESFIYDLTDVLKELGCPYQCLITGPTQLRLAGRNKIVALAFLAGCCQRAKMNVIVDRDRTRFIFIMQIINIAVIVNCIQYRVNEQDAKFEYIGDGRCRWL